MNRHNQSIAFALHELQKEDNIQWIEKIVLYGSCARERPKYDSDVDLFIQVKESTPKEVLVRFRIEATAVPYTLPEINLFFSHSAEPSTSRQFNVNLEKEGIVLWQLVH